MLFSSVLFNLGVYRYHFVNFIIQNMVNFDLTHVSLQRMYFAVVGWSILQMSAR